MRKESDSRSILARVREVLRPRARIEMRLRGDGEVRGRLDGLTPRLLLELVGAARNDARVAVRDASLPLRDRDPRRAPRARRRAPPATAATRAASAPWPASSASAPGASWCLPRREPIRGELTGTLFDQLARPLAAARGAVAASTGARTMHVERIALDEASLEDYLRATPDPARAIIRRLGAARRRGRCFSPGRWRPRCWKICWSIWPRGAPSVAGGRTWTAWSGARVLPRAVEAALRRMRAQACHATAAARCSRALLRTEPSPRPASICRPRDRPRRATTRPRRSRTR